MDFEESGNEWKSSLQKMKEYSVAGDRDKVIISAGLCFYFQNQELKGLPDYLEFGSEEYSKAIDNFVDEVINEFDKQHPTKS